MDSTSFGRKTARFPKAATSRDGRRTDGETRHGRFGHAERRSDSLAELKNLDREIIRLIIKRKRLLATLPKNGAAGRERDLRSAWEEAATSESRDPRFIRDLFALLQEVEVCPAQAEKAPAFNLAPPREPVEIDLSSPVSSRLARLYLTLAAAAGTRCSLTGLCLNASEVACLKAFNQTGAQLRWEEPDRIECTEGAGVSGRTGTVLDKVVHLGNDPLNLYLFLFQMLTRPARLKLVGEGDLKFLNLAALRRLLAVLGARLTQVVPGQEGLPVRLESSAMLPDVVRPEADVPADAVTALLLASPFWDRPVTFHLEDVPGAEAVLAEAEEVLQACGVRLELAGTTLKVFPGTVRTPEAPQLDMDAVVAGYLLAFPAFAGGRVTLAGRWPHTPCSDQLLDLLRQRLEVTVKATGIESRRVAACSAPAADPADLTALPKALVPLGLALALLTPMHNGGGEAPRLPEFVDPAVADDFAVRAGLVREGHRLRPAGSEQDAAAQRPWAAPDAYWAWALALLSLERPQLKLSNPAAATARLPWFWKLYNALPLPADALKTPPQETPVGRVRRRILAGYMPASEMPEPLHEDDE